MTRYHYHDAKPVRCTPWVILRGFEVSGAPAGCDSALHAAARKRDDGSAVRAALGMHPPERHVDLLLARTVDGETPLDVACREGSAGAVEALLAKAGEVARHGRQAPKAEEAQAYAAVGELLVRAMVELVRRDRADVMEHIVARHPGVLRVRSLELHQCAS